MSKFIVDFSKWQDKQLPWPTERHIKVAIFSNNDEFKAYHDIAGHMIIECENQPMDIVECGIYWKEMKDER